MSEVDRHARLFDCQSVTIAYQFAIYSYRAVSTGNLYQFGFVFPIKNEHGASTVKHSANFFFMLCFPLYCSEAVSLFACFLVTWNGESSDVNSPDAHAVPVILLGPLNPTGNATDDATVQT